MEQLESLLDAEFIGQLLISGLLAGCLYALLACGLNLIFGVMRVINIAHTEFMLMGAYAAYAFYTIGLHPLLALPIIILGMFLLGMLIQRYYIEHVVNQPLLTSLLATYALSIILVNLGLLTFSADFVSIPELSGTLLIGDLVISKPRAIAALISVIMTLGVFLFLRYSQLGKAIRAVAEHAEVATVCGIDVVRIRMFTFGLATAMAGTAGVMLTIIYSFSPESGADFISKCFAIIVIGGMGQFIGAFYGGLLLGIIEALIGGIFSTQWADAVAYLLLVMVLLIRPSGLQGVVHAN
jgi:branched-chain amino acid transport system permease protein